MYQGVEVISEFGMYLILMLDSFKAKLLSFGVSGYLGSTFILCAILIWIFSIGTKIPDGSIKSFKYGIYCFIFCGVTYILGSLLPSTSQLVAIKVVPLIVNNEKVQSIPIKYLTFLENILDTSIESSNNSTISK